VPINERRIAGHEISVEPDGDPRELDDPTDDDGFAQLVLTL